MSDNTPATDPLRSEPSRTLPDSGPAAPAQPRPQFVPGDSLPPGASGDQHVVNEPSPYAQPGANDDPNGYPQPGASGEPSTYPQPGASGEPSAYPQPGLDAAGPYSAMPPTELPTERVGRGLALSLVAIPAAMLLTAVIWRLGFIASISAFVLAALAVILYRRGSGGLVKRGIPGLIAVILLGSVACFFSAVITDLVQYYGKQSPADQAGLGTMGEFVGANLFYGPVLSSYGKDAILFGVFAVLGIFGTLRRLLRSTRSA